MRHRKYNFATLILHRALCVEQKFIDDASKGKSYRQQPGAVRKPLKPNICYNLGLALLKTERPVEAMQQFRNALGALGKQPYIWLRMAECCIEIDSLKIHARVGKNVGVGGKAASPVEVVSKGRSRRIVLK